MSRTGAGRLLVAWLFVIVAIVFLVGAILSRWDTVDEALAEARPIWLVPAMIAAGLGMTALAWPWRDVIGLFGEDVGRRRAIAWYFRGELGKYIPGGVWAVVGRGELSRRGGLTSSVAYASVALSLGFAYLAASVMAVLLLGPALAGGVGAAGFAWLPPIAVIIGLLAVHPAVMGRVVAVAERVSGRTVEQPLPSWSRSVRVVSTYLPAWGLIAIATWCVTRSLSPDARLAEIGFAAVLSWIVGFVVVFAPGGAGVREATFGAVAPLPFGVGITVAVLARVLFMCVDAVAAVVSIPLLGSGGSDPSPGDPRSGRRRSRITR